MKGCKFTLPASYTNIVAPITPKMKMFDGIGSLLNITGTYYNVNSGVKALCKASESIVKINDVWNSVGKDLRKSTDLFAQINNLPEYPINKLLNLK